MIEVKELENGLVEVTSTKGFVDIGMGASKAIICSKEEVQYINETENENPGT